MISIWKTKHMAKPSQEEECVVNSNRIEYCVLSWFAEFSCVSVYLASSYCLLMVQNMNLLRKIMPEPMQFLFYINIIFLSTTYIWTCLDYTSLYSSRNRLCMIGGSYVAFGLGQFRVRVANHSATLNLFFFFLVCNRCRVCILYSCTFV